MKKRANESSLLPLALLISEGGLLCGQHTAPSLELRWLLIHVTSRQGTVVDKSQLRFSGDRARRLRSSPCCVFHWQSSDFSVNEHEREETEDECVYHADDSDPVGPLDITCARIVRASVFTTDSFDLGRFPTNWVDKARDQHAESWGEREWLVFFKFIIFKFYQK